MFSFMENLSSSLLLTYYFSNTCGNNYSKTNFMEDILNLDQFCVQAYKVNHLVGVGEDVMAKLKEFIESPLSPRSNAKLSDYLKTLNESPHELTVSFYGLRLVFCIEINLTRSEGQAAIAAYRLSYDHEPKQIPIGVRYTFDKNGNMFRVVNGKSNVVFPAGLFPRNFLEEVITAIANGKEEYVLRPFNQRLHACPSSPD
jgi:hypothetical protein